MGASTHCDHPLHAFDERGQVQGSYVVCRERNRTIVKCALCDKFYGAVFGARGRRQFQLEYAALEESADEQLVTDSEREGARIVLPAVPPEPLEETPQAASQRRGGLDFRRLRDSVFISDDLKTLDWKPVKQCGAQLRGPCPVHGSSGSQSTSFSVNVERSIWRCFSRCARGGNQLELYALATGRSLGGRSFLEACEELCERLAIEIPYRAQG